MSDDSAVIERVASLIRSEIRDDASPAENRRGQAHLAAALAAGRARPPVSAFRVALACAALVLVLVGALFATRLSYAIEPAKSAAGEPGNDRPERVLLFSEGTRIKLLAGGSGHVGRIGLRGAEFVLEEGTLEADVVHRPFASWSVNAGPFTVDVKGTRFSVSWSSQLQKLQLSLYEGAVEVRGGRLKEARRVRTGEKLTLELGAGELAVSSATAGIGSATPTDVASPLALKEQELELPVEPADTALPSRSAPAKSSSDAVKPQSSASAFAPSTPQSSSWTARVAAGDFAGVVQEARAQGVEAVLKSATPADLSALADAARYVGDRQLSSQALASQRQRFAGTERATVAAFLLGRLAEEQGDSRAALSSYDRYLDEQPNGTFGQEALGRKMLILQREGLPTALEVARQYLKRFPDGPRSAVARRIVGQR